MHVKKSVMCDKYVNKIKKYDTTFFENIAPVKITEARSVKLKTKSWSIITEYYLESVKINCLKTGEYSSTATLKIGDRSGNVVCLVKDHSIGILFGVTAEEWNDVEKLCGEKQQLFYRYFKDGLSKNFSFEQTLFYNFCLNSQQTDVLVCVFRRGVNTRNKDKQDVFLEILELKKCDVNLLDLYVNALRDKTVLL